MAQPNLHFPIKQHVPALVGPDAGFNAVLAIMITRLTQQHEATLAQMDQQHKESLDQLVQNHKALLAQEDQYHKAALAQQAQHHRGIMQHMDALEAALQKMQVCHIYP